ncbi:MAG TPA: sugar ABC transporter substrate-binding protein [bacterium]|nr:sugar ABC transporter substrate-binding protein [bacterium]
MKNVLLILLAAGLFFGLSQFFIQQNHRPPDGQVHLTLWNMPPKSLPLDRQLWEEEVQRFEKENPGIAVEGVEREYQPEEFITVMAGGKGPDLVKVWAGAIQTLASLGFLEPIDSYMQNWSQQDFMPPTMWQSTQVGSHLYGVPSDTNFLFLFYRKDLFTEAGIPADQPPANWADLQADARKLTHRNAGQYGLGLIPKTWYFQDFVWQAGGEMIRMENGKPRAAFAEAPAVLALQFWKDLRFKDNVLQPDVLIQEPELLHLFALGKVAMMFGVANQLPPLISRYKIDPKTIGIAPLPAGPAGKAAHLGGNVYVINSTADEDRKKAAWKWIEFDLSPVNQLWKWTRMRELGMVIFPGAFSPSAQVNNLPEFQMVADSMNMAKFEPHVNGWPQVRDLLDSDPLQNILLDPEADPRALLLSFARQADRDIFAKVPATP